MNSLSFCATVACSCSVGRRGELMKDFRAGMITTELLGKAFEPEQAYENPDGTPITFDRDYYGAHRGAEVLPGPFAGSGTEFAL